ncbi:MAG TPA: acyltransferase [Actinomycetota bacterium]|nr:acyltransferase [Actinomycetota bacterium]
MTSVAEIERRTPEGRDRYADFLRALSIVVVVAGHWLAAVVWLRDGRFGGTNALEVVPGLWALTWVLQVMPLFFFVGGFANARGIASTRRRGGTVGDFVGARLRRLLRPTVAFVAVWVPLGAILTIALDGAAATTVGRLAAVPLWFLGVYAAVIAVAPVMLRLHERFGVRVVVVLAAAAAAVDVVRIATGAPDSPIALLNWITVWLFAHQLGFFYADGSLARIPRPAFAAGAVAALGALAALVSTGVYSPSMVGMDDGKLSNNNPPSVCMVLMTLWLVSAAMLARPTVRRWLDRPRPWAAVVRLNTVIMTVYLWHLTAMAIGIAIALPFGWPHGRPPGTAEWWALRPAWLLLHALVLVPLVRTFARFETRPDPSVGTPTAAALGGAAAASAGTAGLALGGMSFAGAGATGPLAPALLVVAGAALVRGRRR